MNERRQMQACAQGNTVHRGASWWQRLLAWTMPGASITFGGCGLESAGSAATAGATRRVGLVQACKAQDEVKQQVQQSMDQMQKLSEQLQGVAQWSTLKYSFQAANGLRACSRS